MSLGRNYWLMGGLLSTFSRFGRFGIDRIKMKN